VTKKINEAFPSDNSDVGDVLEDSSYEFDDNKNKQYATTSSNNK
jgi:hypothetical protein